MKTRNNKAVASKLLHAFSAKLGSAPELEWHYCSANRVGAEAIHIDSPLKEYEAIRVYHAKGRAGIVLTTGVSGIVEDVFDAPDDTNSVIKLWACLCGLLRGIDIASPVD